MKTNFIKPFLVPALIAGLSLLPTGRMTAQTFTTLHSFTGNNFGNPVAGVITISSGNTLYGTTSGDGSTGQGTVFAVHPDGTGFTNLHSFTDSDGYGPRDVLILSDNTLYGTTHGDGSSVFGMVFAVHTDGTSFTNLHSFHRGIDGQGPGILTSSGNIFYGTTELGGPSGEGTVFAVHMDGTGFTNLHSFTGGSDGDLPLGVLFSGNTLYGTTLRGGSSNVGTVFGVNTDGTGFTNLHSFTGGSDGHYPDAALILSGNTLYGTVLVGGSFGPTKVFKVNIDGTGFTTLHDFTASDGTGLAGRLILSGNSLYGTAANGGSSGNGTVFAVKTDGTGLTTLHNFTATSAPDYSNSDGTAPAGGLILSGNTLYGTAGRGGSSSWGTVFAVNTDGTGFTNLRSLGTGFTVVNTNSSGAYTNSDGANPEGGLILAGNTLYGTAANGGNSGNGTVFSLSFAPQLTIAPSGLNVVLTWPTNVAGFDYTGYTLQSATTLTGPFTNLPAATNPYTNPITGPQQFFRLTQ